MRPFGVRVPCPVASLLLVFLLGCRETESPTGPEPEPALATTAAALAFSGISGGTEFSCGLTTDNRAFCWGVNDRGQLGDGSTTERHKPVPVTGGLRFRQLSAGSHVTCGVTTDFRAYCWGVNDVGELGDGTTTNRLTPVAVTGGRKFSQLEINAEHVCALSYPDNKAYCWGRNNQGQLGEGTNTGPQTGPFGPYSSKPVAVLGGLTFRRLSTGRQHSCGVTTSNKIYCWGLNQDGQLGDGTTVRRKSPRLVTGGLAFSWVDAGSNYTCGVTTGSKAYCWGYGKNGQRGDGSITERVTAPRAVFGNHSFFRVSAAFSHTCAVTPSSQAWCWGVNANGQLGNGTTSNTNSLTPQMVAGGLALDQVSTGLLHTCGKTTSSVGYCWGRNFNGQLGNGTTAVSSAPTAVVGP